MQSIFCNGESFDIVFKLPKFDAWRVISFTTINLLTYVATPPEVNIEVPSDSDSSRRPSVYSGRRRSSYQIMSDASSVNDFQGQEVKSCEDKLGSSGNNVSNDQKISSGDAEFGSCKRSNSGQMLSNQTGDTGK